MKNYNGIKIVSSIGKKLNQNDNLLCHNENYREIMHCEFFVVSVVDVVGFTFVACCCCLYSSSVFRNRRDASRHRDLRAFLPGL